MDGDSSGHENYGGPVEQEAAPVSPDARSGAYSLPNGLVLIFHANPHFAIVEKSKSPAGEIHWPKSSTLCVVGRAARDRSSADFFWFMMAALRGWSIEETANKLLEVSAKAQERARLGDDGYALITAQNAAAEAARGRQKSGG